MWLLEEDREKLTWKGLPVLESSAQKQNSCVQQSLEEEQGRQICYLFHRRQQSSRACKAHLTDSHQPLG